MGLAITAVLASLVGAFYYLRVVKVMYFDEPIDHSEISGNGMARTVLTLNGMFVLLGGIFPATITALCLTAMRATMQG